MKKSQRFTMMLLAAMAASSAMATDQVLDRVRDPDATTAKDRLSQRDRLRDRDVYGSQLMTAEERVAYRAAMQAAKTPEERERVRAAHHEQMKIRAKERGVTLPDTPPAKRGGMGRGAGAGTGPGAGAGPGSGQGAGAGAGAGGARSGARSGAGGQ